MTDLEKMAWKYASKVQAFRLGTTGSVVRDYLAGAAARQPEVDALVAEVTLLKSQVAGLQDHIAELEGMK